MNAKPVSALEQTNGLTWFPRMLDKIRLHAAGNLHPDFHRNLGLKIGADGMCCAMLGVEYGAVVERVKNGGTNEEILDWCYETGHRLRKIDLHIWNEFVRKFGWNDRATPVLERLKSESQLSHRQDIVTMVDYLEVDEGRKP